MKKLASFCLALVMIFSFPSVTAFAEESSAPIDHLIIDQVYGGGGKEETPISNSFIELYNPTAGEISLSGYTLVYGDKTLDLTGTIPAERSFLVIGKENPTTDEFLTYDLPTADQNCDWGIDNKSYTISLKKGETEIDSVTGNSKDSDSTKQISKQKSLKRTDHGEFKVVVWEKVKVTVDAAYVETNAPRNSKGEYGSVHGASSETGSTPDPGPTPEPAEPTYTPVVTGDTRVKGFYNSADSIQLELSGRYNSQAMSEEGGSLEIVQYNPINGFAYAVSGVKGKLIAVDLNGSQDGEKVVTLSGAEYDVKTLTGIANYGDMTSVAVSPDGTRMAVAIQAESYKENGYAALFACKEDGSLECLSKVTVGVQPDMITFVDNNTILTADEGEPREGTADVDPKGSVSIVTVGEDNSLTAKTVYFDSFDAKRDELTAAGVLVQKDTNPSTDFEPEYIAVSGNTAYVSLQEANAIAVLDIAKATFTGVYPLGFQNYGSVKVDLEKNDKIEFKNYENVYGIKMPDGISVTTIGGKTYLLTANEGDSRSDWAGLDNESEGKTSPTGNVTLDSKVVWFNATMWDGLDSNNAYVFGGRSFSIYEATENGLTLVYDSGSDFEAMTAEKLPGYFNTSNNKTDIDNRSGKKGPEPESVITGTIGDKTFAFIALERIGGIMVYDITDPSNAKFANYINSREFDDKIKGDVSPEGLCFIPAGKSKTGRTMLLAACEVSGTLAAYTCTYDAPAAPEEETPAECEHTYTNAVTKEPTTDSEGVRTYTCSKCGHTYTESIAKLPQKTEDVSDTEKTEDTKSGEWKQVDGKWHYENADGSQQSNGWALIDDKWYAFDESGNMETGWKKDGNDWYYLGSSGAMETGWVLDGSDWYYMNKSGAMQTGWELVDDTWYYMNASGAMETGWIWDGANWYYMNASGAMETGWKQVGGTWYYLNTNGAMATGWVWDGSNWYYMNADGAMQTGWQTIGGIRYYLQPSGAMSVGWTKVGTKWHYFNRDGAMVFSSIIDGYRLNRKGVWVR